MALSAIVTRVIAFLRAGYPDGVPTRDYIPLMALLRRRLTDDEVLAVADELAAGADDAVDGIDVRVAITKLTDELPSAEDTERVKRRLVAVGWPIAGDFDTTE
jgi:Protein of unknown function (DUF3349)